MDSRIKGRIGQNSEEKVIVAPQTVGKLVEMSLQPDCNNVILTSFAHCFCQLLDILLAVTTRCFMNRDNVCGCGYQLHLLRRNTC